MTSLTQKLNRAFEGKTVRKDLVHRIKKGTNVPTFVLEFLLAKYCASDDPAEIEAGMEAVLQTLQENYVRPDEANAAQSKVAQKGKHRFIDKVSVRYVEKEKRHWAELENFNSKRIAIPNKYYADNERLLEGGIWAEVTIAHNPIEDDDYAFEIDELRPVQMSRFDFDSYVEGRKEFTRDEWLDIVLRSVGLEPSKISHRVKLHFISRLTPLVEANLNFIELGPRGTGKSYFYSEFSPYSTLISGGQATKATLFYNNARKRVGLVGFWDTVAFDEVAGIKIKDPDTIQIMKDFMANGRFSRGNEVIADASLAFVGNIDMSVEQLVRSAKHDLFQPLPPEFDLAVMDRFAFYLPGWEMPKNGSELLTDDFGLITDYLAEAFHHLFKHSNRYAEVNDRIRLGKHVQGRDEKGIKKTLAAFLKILHPAGPPTEEEFEEYVAYAVEGRRRVKEQMNKRKADDEFALIQLSFVGKDGEERIVFCPESEGVEAMQYPMRAQMAISGETSPDQKPRKGNRSAPAEERVGSEERKDAPPPPVRNLSLDQLIKLGESGSLEFKASFQWDVNQQKKNEDLRREVMKTVVSFLNSHGGTLLIGVEDSGSVRGLEDDLNLMQGSRDKFDRTLAALLMDQIGAEHMTCVRMRFDSVDGKSVYVIDVDAGVKPAFAKSPKGREFFIRVGSTTQPLDTEAAMKYVQTRW
jgi:ATP-dependent Lon protease